MTCCTEPSNASQFRAPSSSIEDFSERGVSLTLSYNPTPSTPLGFVARVAPSWGGQAMSGAEALWGRETMAGMAQGGVAQGNRLDGEVGYGLPVGSRFVGTPAGRLQHLGVRPGLSGRLRPRRPRPGEHELRARGRGAAPQQSGARGLEQRAARAGHAGLVRNAQPFGCYRPGCARERAPVGRVDPAVPGAVRAPRLAAPHPSSARRGPQHRGAGTAGRRRLDGVGRGGDAGGRRVSGARACGWAWARAIA